MSFEKTSGLITIIVGLLLMIFPIFSSDLISVIVGLSLIFFGLSVLVTGLRSDTSNSKTMMIVIGIVGFFFNTCFDNGYCFNSSWSIFTQSTDIHCNHYWSRIDY